MNFHNFKNNFAVTCFLIIFFKRFNVDILGRGQALSLVQTNSSTRIFSGETFTELTDCYHIVRNKLLVDQFFSIIHNFLSILAD